MDECFKYALSGKRKNLEEKIKGFWFWKNRNIVNYQKDSGESLLIAASKNGQLGIVKLLVENFECDLNIKDIHGNTALMWSIFEKQYAVTHYLLKTEKVSMEAENDSGETCLSLAIRANDYNNARSMILMGAHKLKPSVYKSVLKNLGENAYSGIFNGISYLWSFVQLPHYNMIEFCSHKELPGECPVCMENKNVLWLKCDYYISHSICKQCYDKVKDKNGEFFCPVCRRKSEPLM